MNKFTVILKVLLGFSMQRQNLPALPDCFRMPATTRKTSEKNKLPKPTLVYNYFELISFRVLCSKQPVKNALKNA